MFISVQRASVRCLIPERSPLRAVNIHFQTVMLLTVHVFWRQSHVLSLLPLDVAFCVVLSCLKEVSYPLRFCCGYISAVVPVVCRYGSPDSRICNIFHLGCGWHPIILVTMCVHSPVNFQSSGQMIIMIGICHHQKSWKVRK